MNLPPAGDNNELLDWYHLEPNDTLSGLSIQKAYDEGLVSESSREIIVAVIDTEVDIEHEDLKKQIYVNPNEIPNNKIDDDNNGYIDDIHGWNYLGTKDGKPIYFGNYEHTRVLRKLTAKYNLKNFNFEAIDNETDSKLFQKALKLREKSIAHSERLIEWSDGLRENYFKAKRKYSEIFVDDNYTLAGLDTMKVENEEDKKLIEFLKYYVQVGFTPELINSLIKDSYGQRFLLNNLNYDPKAAIDSIEQAAAIGHYGNNSVGDFADVFQHGTQVAGIIGATRNNTKGIKGFSNNIKLMILAVSPLGDETCEDFIAAVKYAVDNGAKVINFSSGKNIIECEQEVFDILQYAMSKDVLFITSAGNSGKNIDKPENTYYPRGISPDTKQTLDNFIMVAASGKRTDSTIYAKFSNYGKKSVDIFAPGENLMVTDVGQEKYFILGGTSLSTAITSGVASLIMLEYPELSATQVKEIILKSGIAYDIKVNTTEGALNFKDLSRSGAVINLYNALVLADEVTNNQK